MKSNKTEVRAVAPTGGSEQYSQRASQGVEASLGSSNGTISDTLMLDNQ